MSTPHAALEFRDIGGGQMTIRLVIDGKIMKPKEIAASTLSPSQMIAARMMIDLHQHAELAKAKLSKGTH